jgi:DNA-binding response OmpR family regulator
LPELFCENHVWLAEAIMPDQTILLVDDEKEILELAASFLGGAGYRAITALNGDVALIILQQPGISFDLLITDIMMPGELNGFALAREARELCPKLPIIYMTGFSAATGHAHGAPAGEILSKPWSAERLLGSVQAALGGLGMPQEQL